MKKILKSGGHCCDGCQWFHCDFFRVEEHITHRLIPTSSSLISEYESEKRYSFHCDMFGGAELTVGSLNICNKIYGHNYEGAP